jgi:hypothetical protein
MIMTLPKAVRQDSYTEAEAALALGISIARLHQLLDEYIFNEGRRRPRDLDFNGRDLLLLAYWNRESRADSPEPGNDKVVLITSHR